MAGVLTRTGRLLTARPWAGQGFPSDGSYQVRLIVADFSMTPTVSLGALTEATFGGYAAIGFELSSSSGPTLEGDDYVVNLRGAPFVWDCTSAPQTVYGWVLWSGDEGEILAGERYDDPDELEVGSRHTLYASIKIGQCA